MSPDEVGRAAARDLVDQLVADVADVLLQSWPIMRGVKPRLTRERLPGVLRRVLVEHHHPLQRELLLGRLVEERELLVRGEGGVVGDIDHAGMAVEVGVRKIGQGQQPTGCRRDVAGPHQ